MEFYHIPVLAEPAVSALVTDRSEAAVYVDGTLGGGGHASMILERMAGRLIGIDRDRAAIEAATARIHSERLTTVWGNHDDITEHLEGLNIPNVSGILLDLGTSSFQFDEGSRGFSYNAEAPLDMRMDNSSGITAADVVNMYSHGELARVIREYGEERWASRIANFILKARPLATTFDLVKCVCAAIPSSARRDGPHPARRTFQAVRIEVNGELRRLSDTIEAAVRRIRPGGRACLISFHSLEDRIVKHTFRRMQNPCVCPPPICTCSLRSLGKVRNDLGATPCESEIEENPRSRSARLRVFERQADS